MSEPQSFVARQIARALLREPPPSAMGDRESSGGSDEDQRAIESSLRERDYSRGFCFIFPTYVSRLSTPNFLEVAGEFQNQLARVHTRFPERPLLAFFAVQYIPGQKNEAQRRASLLGDLFQKSGIPVYGIALPKNGKVFSLNTVFRLTANLGLSGIGWIDDDVWLEPECLALVTADFVRRNELGSVGARKSGHPDQQRSARALHFFKKATRTQQTAFPHGCCMIVEAKVAGEGIPSGYCCDDDYFCYRLLEPTAPNPMSRMAIAQDAVCHHTVGGTPAQSYRRIRRTFLSNQVMQADFGPPKSDWFRRHIQFYGFWPFAPFDHSRGLLHGLRKALLKSIYFGWYACVGAELFVRGLIRRPLVDIPWGGYATWGFAIARSEAALKPSPSAIKSGVLTTRSVNQHENSAQSAAIRESTPARERPSGYI